ncbi:MAG: hypothetical protein KAI25_14810, partial [Hyphomicrobiaceae bacterium]|nr:hypothetical protein [Hyphomicrobiaceae bacterium]
FLFMGKTPSTVYLVLKSNQAGSEGPNRTVQKRSKRKVARDIPQQPRAVRFLATRIRTKFRIAPLCVKRNAAPFARK